MHLFFEVMSKDSHIFLLSIYLLQMSLFWNVRGMKIKFHFKKNVYIFFSEKMQRVTLYGTRSAAASGKSFEPCRDGSRLA